VKIFLEKGEHVTLDHQKPVKNRRVPINRRRIQPYLPHKDWTSCSGSMDQCKLWNIHQDMKSRENHGNVSGLPQVMAIAILIALQWGMCQNMMISRCIWGIAAYPYVPIFCNFHEKNDSRPSDSDNPTSNDWKHCASHQNWTVLLQKELVLQRCQGPGRIVRKSNQLLSC
jgi:hypothetical protein